MHAKHGRRDRRPYLTHLPFALVMAVVAVAGLRIWMYHWRQGAALIAVALLVAAVLRAVLAEDKSGLLVIRGRGIDVLCYGGLGLVIMFVAVTIDPGPVL